MALKKVITNFTSFFRPRRFKDVVGNKVPIKILSNHLRKNMFKTGYLLLGPAGVGKTTVAYILAKSVNCLRPTDIGEPCGCCESCSYAEGEHPDIRIINAALMNKVSDIEEIIDDIKSHVVQHRKLCIIMDEWHNLTSAARERLLDILEAAKMNASSSCETDYLFILPTTTVDNMPKSLISRLTELHFTAPTKSEMVEHLQDICSQVGWNAHIEALELIYQKSGAGIRKAQNFLEDIIDYSSEVSESTIVTLQNTQEVLASSASIIAEPIFESILSFNLSSTRNLITKHAEENVIRQNDFNDLYKLTEDFIDRCNRPVTGELLRALEKIVQLRNEFIKSPVNDGHNSLVLAAKYIITIFQDTFFDKLSNYIKAKDTTYWELINKARPNLFFDKNSGGFVLVIDRPNIEAEFNYLEAGFRTNFITEIFYNLGINYHAFR